MTQASTLVDALNMLRTRFDNPELIGADALEQRLTISESINVSAELDGLSFFEAVMRVCVTAVVRHPTSRGLHLVRLEPKCGSYSVKAILCAGSIYDDTHLGTIVYHDNAEVEGDVLAALSFHTTVQASDRLSYVRFIHLLMKVFKKMCDFEGIACHMTNLDRASNVHAMDSFPRDIYIFFA